jgi:hypothetical protein
MPNRHQRRLRARKQPRRPQRRSSTNFRTLILALILLGLAAAVAVSRVL